MIVAREGFVVEEGQDGARFGQDNNDDGRLLVDNYPQMSISKPRAAKWSYLCWDEIESISTHACATIIFGEMTP